MSKPVLNAGGSVPLQHRGFRVGAKGTFTQDCGLARAGDTFMISEVDSTNDTMVIIIDETGTSHRCYIGDRNRPDRVAVD